MSFRRAARAALAGQSGLPWVLVAVVVILAGLSLSCGNSSTLTAPNHDAYVTLPGTGQVLQLFIDGTTGALTMGAQTPQQLDTTPTALVLLPSKNILYAINSFADSISMFNIASDGSLTLSDISTPTGSGPTAAVIDPSGQYLLVTNYYANSVSIFSIDPGTGALTELTGLGSPFYANEDPTEILITPSGKFVYVTNPGSLGMVTAFTFSNGVLAQVSNSPFPSGAGAGALAVDSSERFLYVANFSASNPPPSFTQGNISGFNIEQSGPNAGALTPMLGSPFYPAAGSGPSSIAVDPTGRFVYAVTTGSSYSIWCFTIDYSANGQLVAATHSPFSLPAGDLFALFAPSGNYFYIGSQAGIEGYTYNPSTGALTVIRYSPFSTGTPPTAPGKMVFSE